jgi:hypothetical protein
VKKRKTIASLARGHVRALAGRGIKIDAGGRRARKDGRPISREKLERAVAAIERAKKRPAKPAAKKTAPRRRPGELSERDAFILESLVRNHLTPEVQKRYIKNLSAAGREVLKQREVKERIAAAGREEKERREKEEERARRAEEKERARMEELRANWAKADVLLKQAIQSKSFFMEWEVIAKVLGLPPREVFERGLTLQGARPGAVKVTWKDWQRAERLIRDAIRRGTFDSEYDRIAAATGLTAREIYTLGISPPSLGTATA